MIEINTPASIFTRSHVPLEKDPSRWHLSTDRVGLHYTLKREDPVGPAYDSVYLLHFMELRELRYDGIRITHLFTPSHVLYRFPWIEAESDLHWLKELLKSKEWFEWLATVYQPLSTAKDMNHD